MIHVLLAEINLASVQSMFGSWQASISNFVRDKGTEFLANSIAALAILIAGMWAARLAVRLLDRVLAKAKLDVTLAKFLCRVAHALIVCVVVLASLDRLGVNTTSIAAIMAAAGLAIGMALQGSLSNFAAGVMIILFRPFKVGDFVDAGGAKGFVEEIHIFNTMIRTPDNVEIIVPNNAITSGNISNFSAQTTRRIDLVVGCGYDDDLKQVKQFLQQLLVSDQRILSEPEPVVAVDELGDNCVNFVVRPWVASSDYWTVRWDLTENIKVGFDERGFSIPFPQRDIHVFPSIADQPQSGTTPTSPVARQLTQPRRVG